MSKIETRTNQIPLGEHYISVQTFRQNDANTIITNFYQVGESSISLMSMLDLLDLLKEDPLFDILRTKEQLGYDVSGSVRANYGILGYAIAVNSQEDKFDAAFVEDRIEKFRQAFREILENMASEEFELFKNSLIKLKLVEDTELKDEVSDFGLCCSLIPY
jgi:nardilysin